MKWHALLVLLALASPVWAQEGSQVALGGPRFLRSATPGAEPVDPTSVEALQRRVTLTAREATLGEALAAITRQTGVRFLLSPDVVPVRTPVRVEATGLSLAAALTELLLNAQVDVAVASPRELALVRRRGTRTQPGSIAGRVTDAKTGEGLPAAEVFLEGTKIRTGTGDDGSYRLNQVEAGNYTLSVRRLGYAKQSQPVSVTEGEEVNLDVPLEPVATELNEIVTTVTGEQRLLELGHVVGRINADSVMQIAPVTNFADLLQGRIPGVFSTFTPTQVGRSGSILVRGPNSISLPNDPIFVVDGVRVDATPGNGGNFIFSTSSGGFTGRLLDIDPTEISSVEVVKGPSAATLYGTDAANGVVLVTTKRGQAGPPRWSAFSEQGLIQQRMDEFADPFYAFGHSTADGSAQRCTLLNRAEGSCVLDSLVSFNTFTDPATRPFHNGYRQQYGLQVSGGTTGGATYFLGGDYEHETGTYAMAPSDRVFLQAERGVTSLPEWQLKPNAYEKINLRANLSAPVGRRGAVTVSTGYVSNQARQAGGSTLAFPTFQTGYRDANDGWASVDQRPGYYFSTRGEDVVHRFTGSITGNYSALEWLTLRGTAGVDLSANSFGALTLRGEGAPGSSVQRGERIVNELDVTRVSFDLGATAARSLSQSLTSKTSVGAQYNRRGQRGAFVLAGDLPIGGQTLAGAADRSGGSEITLSTAVAGAYVEEALAFRDRLFVTGALRLDGGSAFGEDFSVAAYPKLSGSWLVRDGQANPGPLGLSTLRLRAAYGTSGVQPDPTAALQQLVAFPGLSGTTPVPAAILGAFGNPDLKPERSTELEAGVDVELASGQVRLQLTGYQRTSHDALINRALGPDVGGGTRWENIGTIRNRGIEAMLAMDFLRGPGLSAGLTLTGSVNQNRLLELGDNVQLSAPEDQGTRHTVGYPISGVWGRSVESFADANGNGIIEAGEITLTKSQFIGSFNPTREATAAPYLGLFGDRLRLNALVQYSGGRILFDNIEPFNCFFQSCRAVNDVNTPLAQQADMVAFTNFFAVGTLARRADYIMLRELSAAYTVPPRVARVVGASGMRVVLSGRNVAALWRRTPRFGIESETGPLSYWLVRINLNY